MRLLRQHSRHTAREHRSGDEIMKKPLAALFGLLCLCLSEASAVHAEERAPNVAEQYPDIVRKLQSQLEQVPQPTRRGA